MSRVLVISGDIVPFEGLPTAGAGMRIWGLAQGLKGKGHEIIFALPVELEERVQGKGQEKIYFFNRSNFKNIVRNVRPEVLLFQTWALALFGEKCNIPLVIDFHGPALLEGQSCGFPRNFNQYIKLKAISIADFLTCAGERQKYYFWAWLIAAGLEVRHDMISVIPVSLSPYLPAREEDKDITFVYGGTFREGQNPRLALEVLVQVMDKLGKGRFLIFGSKLTIGKTGMFSSNLIEKLSKSHRVFVQGRVPRDKLIREYCRSTVAVDLMERNAERELAFTTRTVEYLWCGLPVIYNDYSELSSYINGYKAGWTLSPEDKEGLKKVIEEILLYPERVKRLSFEAQRLVCDKFTWDKTIEPLHRFCLSPARSDSRYNPPGMLKDNLKLAEHKIKHFFKK